MDRLQLDTLEKLFGKEEVEHMKQAQAQAQAEGLGQDATCCDEDQGEVLLLAKGLLSSALETLKIARPEERSELSRRFAICITDLEKVFAYYHTYICDCSLPEAP